MSRYWVHSDPEAPAATGPAVPCPGDCNRGWRRAERAYAAAWASWQAAVQAATGGDLSGVPPEPERHTVPCTDGEPIWCPPCTGRIRAGLHRLPDLAAAVRINDDGRLPHLPESVRSATRTGSPSGSPAFDTVDEIVQWACGWEDTARRTVGEPGAVWPSWTVGWWQALSRASAFLEGWHTELLADSGLARDLGVQTLALVGWVERVAGLDGTLTRLRAPCRRCDLVAYERHDGSERVECRHCRDVMSMADYEQWARLCAAAVKDRAG